MTAMTISRRLANAFDAHADAAALLTQDGQSVSFARLSVLISRLHTHLSRAGFGPGDWGVLNIDNPTVAICLRLALLRLGVTIALTNTSRVLLDNGIKVDFEIVYGGQAASDPRVRVVEFQQEWLDVDAGNEPEWSSQGELIFSTSGSSGRPKYLANNFDNLYERDRRFESLVGPSLGAHLVTVPVSTSYGSRYLMRTLMAGHGYMGMQGPDRSTLLWAREFEVQELVTTPINLHKFIQEIENGAPKPGFKRITLGGAGATRELLIRAEDMFEAQICVAVGASENGAYGFGVFDRDHFATGWTGRIPEWVETELRDKGQFPTYGPNAGRLAVRIPAEYRVRGYLGHGGDVYDADGWFVPGDIATINASNELRLLGRADFVMNFSGVKHAPEAIEAMLSAEFNPGPIAVTRVAGFNAGEEYLGVVLTQPDVDEAAMEALLKDALDLIAETRFVTVAGLPMLPGGKLNRRALPALFPLG